MKVLVEVSYLNLSLFKKKISCLGIVKLDKLKPLLSRGLLKTYILQATHGKISNWRLEWTSVASYLHLNIFSFENDACSKINYWFCLRDLEYSLELVKGFRVSDFNSFRLVFVRLLVEKIYSLKYRHSFAIKSYNLELELYCNKINSQTMNLKFNLRQSFKLQ